MGSDTLFLTFYGNNIELLRPPLKKGQVAYSLNRRASIKDIIEALGVPHTEAGMLLLNGRELTFQHLPDAGEHIHILPFNHEIPATTPTVLRPRPLGNLRFMFDINVCKIGRNLRMIGLDAVPVPGGTLRDVAAAAAIEERILLSRNRELLKLGDIIYGHLLRSENHQKQLVEVSERYNLKTCLKPFSRCLVCNGILVPAVKKDILGLLEPLTKKYYTEFKQCERCKRVYWQGSHHAQMQKLLRRL
ncbi:MAG: Mut7-C RNAse domain-containing protein [Desulforhopalus sp.]